MPVKPAVTSTTGRDFRPISSIWRTMFPISEGGRKSHPAERTPRTTTFPMAETRPWTCSPRSSTERTNPFFFPAGSVNGYPRHAAPHLGEDLVGDGPRHGGELVRRRPPLPHDDHFRAGR